MNGNRTDRPDRDEERIRRALRSLERLDADPDFERRLRADFVSGRIGERAAPPSPEGKRLVPFPSAWRWAAAAVLLLGLFGALLGTARRTAWSLLEPRGTGNVVVRGRSIPVTDTAVLGRLLAAGARFETRGDAELDLRGNDALAIGVAPGTDIQIQRPPARWLSRVTQIRLFAGELRILTGPRFPGARLVVHTPEGIVRITGTAVAVYRDSTVTCVCVLEGAAAIGVDGEHLDSVPAGKRKVMFADAREPVILDIEPQHRKDLQAFIDRSRPRFDASLP
jgi:ferric-dicitrate binding protein FerR (iron transport regulator)